jgi:hypothetical protein
MQAWATAEKEYVCGSWIANLSTSAGQPFGRTNKQSGKLGDNNESRPISPSGKI